jgi:hypothetical protein
VAGNAVTVGFGWTDPVGANDTYSYDVDWGDGSAHATGSGALSPVSGLTHTYGAGTFTLSVTVSDEDGGTSLPAVQQVQHLFASSGSLAPLGSGRSSFKLGSTVPVKFRWLCGGTPRTDDPAPAVTLVKWSSATDSTPPIDATPTDAATDLNQARLAGDQWHFNWSTKGCSAGVWQITVTQGGASESVFVQLR